MTVQKLMIAGACALVGLIAAADEKPLIWMDDLAYLKAGEKSSYVNNASPVKAEKAGNFVTVKTSRGIMQGLPRGDVFGDYEIKFSFRPKSKNWRIETGHHILTGGSRRFRKDTLKGVWTQIHPTKISVGASYEEKSFEDIQHMTIPPRLIGADLPPFPPIEKGEYPVDPEIFGDGGKWVDAVITVDQYDLKFTFNGETVATHKINPACGRIDLSMIGEFDVKGMLVRALRPGVDPFAEENLVRRDYSNRKKW